MVSGRGEDGDIPVCLHRPGSTPARAVGAIPGTLWEVPAPGRVHHAGYWCDDVQATSAELTASGLSILAKVGVTSGDEDASIVFFQARSGLNIELIASEMRAAMFGEE